VDTEYPRFPSLKALPVVIDIRSRSCNQKKAVDYLAETILWRLLRVSQCVTRAVYKRKINVKVRACTCENKPQEK